MANNHAAASAFQQIALFVKQQRIKRAVLFCPLPSTVKLGAVRGFVAAQKVVRGQNIGRNQHVYFIKHRGDGRVFQVQAACGV